MGSSEVGDPVGYTSSMDILRDISFACLPLFHIKGLKFAPFGLLNELKYIVFKVERLLSWLL